jgi:hypothetical protein
MRYNVNKLNDSIRNMDKTIENMIEQVIIKNRFILFHIFLFKVINK